MRYKSKEYESYINSFDWYLKRRAALERANQRCQRCGTTEGLQVHHLNYDRLGNERDQDLMAVCEPCHKIEDKKREQRTAANHYAARLDGWASKKYGEDWWMDRDHSEVEEEFDEWLEQKERD